MTQPAFGGRLVGYARVSTDDQDLSLQMDSLIGLGITQDDIYTDKVSGAKTDRPGLGACLAKLQEGDTLVVWRLDRLGRSMHHLVELIEELRNRGIGFRSVSDGLIDTTSPSGELIFHIFSALAQFERRLIQERTKAGLASARARGRCGGRPPIDLEEVKVRAARKLHDDHTLNIDDICNTLHISRSTYYRYIRIELKK
jgi:DNA invertase Pin-like site-specific DNA recombinase